MAASLLRRSAQLLRLNHHNHRLLAAGLLRRHWCTSAEPKPHLEDASFNVEKSRSSEWKESISKPKIWEENEDSGWEEVEAEILQDIEPIASLTKEIIHSSRYLDGEQLTVEEAKAVMEKLLVHHPNSEDKIGCGLDSIMVDRHPQYRSSRCLFVVRTDGGWVDFSYIKCLQAYIRNKYPTHAERFIKAHFGYKRRKNE